jgi:hypothetical protein
VRLGRLLIAAVAILACSSGGTTNPPAGFPHAQWTPQCGPADGPAVGLYLASTAIDGAEVPAAPYVHVMLFEAPSVLNGRTWSWEGDSQFGSARLCTRAQECTPASAVTVDMRSFGADSTLRAVVDLRFPGRDPVRGTVQAAHRPRTLLCG